MYVWYVCCMYLTNVQCIFTYIYVSRYASVNLIITPTYEHSMICKINKGKLKKTMKKPKIRVNT